MTRKELGRVADGGVRAIVLDFNGTLAQDDHLVAPLYVDGFASVGATLTVEGYHREFAAMPDHLVFTEAIRRAGLPFDEARRDELVSARRQGYLDAVANEPPIAEHALAFVRAAAGRGLRLAITSGAFRDEIEHVVRAARIEVHFDALVSIDDVHHGKPHPEGFTRALEQVNAGLPADASPIDPGEVIAVEDATDGAEAARAAGMRVAAIRGLGYDPASGLADIVIDRLDPEALDRILTLASSLREADGH
jgi:HAD superfamily hydrolase (TIGR01509 family)